MFDHDALVFDNQITRAGIQLPDGTPYLELRCVGVSMIKRKRSDLAGDPKSCAGSIPNVGKHYNNHYRIHLNMLPSSWSQGWDFTCIDSTLDSVTHQIRSTRHP